MQTPVKNPDQPFQWPMQLGRLRFDCRVQGEFKEGVDLVRDVVSPNALIHILSGLLSKKLDPAPPKRTPGKGSISLEGTAGFAPNLSDPAGALQYRPGRFAPRLQDLG